MTHQEIKELAGHRAVSPWVMKLVNDAVMKEREACAAICDEVNKDMSLGPLEKYRASWIAQAIKARGNK